MTRDIGWPEQLVRLHLADAQLDLSHQQTVHFDEVWGAPGEHEMAVGVDIGACECAVTIGAHVREQLSMHGTLCHGFRSVSGGFE